MKIVIVGGGAGGLELATKLGRKLGRKQRAEIVLIDKNSTHIWKPLLHEVAAGSLDCELDGVNYRLHAYNNGFTFKMGRCCGVDFQQKFISLDAIVDDSGEEVLPQRQESYDQLVLATGSVTNDFGVEGVADNCFFIDNPEQAVKFHRRLLHLFIKLNRRIKSCTTTEPLRVAIVGGGATGVELAAELFKAEEWFATYGLGRDHQGYLKVTLVEAGDRLLPALTDRISQGAYQELQHIGVDVRLGTQVVGATKEALLIKDEGAIAADLIVWAAGVKAPEFFRHLEGVELNRLNQILVEPSLQVQGQDSVFALGDCAGCKIERAGEDPKWVPPRAQSAHQMASCIADNLIRRLDGKPPKPFVYNDFGSLVSLSDYTAFGRLMGGLARGGLSIEGRFARVAYVSLYRMHQLAIFGFWRTVLVALSDRVNHLLRPKYKLH
jgi:NADH dehydrogenase